MFNANDKVTVADYANVRRTPGNVNKDGFDVFTSADPGEVLTVISGPHQVDGMDWYEVDLGGHTGFIAHSHDGFDILVPYNAAAPVVTPSNASGIRLSRPVDHSVVISQLWGENPEFYAQIQGYAAPLRGHNGIDFAAVEGTPVKACDDGVVERAGMDPWGFGNLCVIQHAWGKSYYAHNHSFTVNVGDHVSRGQQVAYSGHTGLGMGAGGAGQDHVHFSIKINGQDDGANGWGGFSNPMDYMEGQW